MSRSSGRPGAAPWLHLHFITWYGTWDLLGQLPMVQNAVRRSQKLLQMLRVCLHSYRDSSLSLPQNIPEERSLIMDLACCLRDYDFRWASALASAYTTSGSFFVTCIICKALPAL